MQIEVFQPVHPVLKNLIAYYYFQKAEDTGFRACYTSFPTTLFPLNIHQNAFCEATGHTVRITGGAKHKHLLLANAIRTAPLNIHQIGPINKITIAFRPLGLNHFVSGTLGPVVGTPVGVFSEWAANTATPLFVARLFTESDRGSQVGLLEKHLLELHRPFREYDSLQPAILQLEDINADDSLQSVAKIMGVGSRTLNRLFHKHLGMSPIIFRQITRFRHSLSGQMRHRGSRRLTKAAYESDFYDQSHFIKTYRTFTGQSPKAFFKTVSVYGHDQVFFRVTQPVVSENYNSSERG